MTKHLLLFPLLCLTCIGSIQGQTDKLTLLKSIEQLNKEKMSYAYTVYLVEDASRRVEDSASGRIYKNRENYLDSNQLIINMRDADYTLQINKVSKKSYVKSIKALDSLFKKRNAAMPEPVLDMKKLLLENIVSASSHKDGSGHTVVNVQFRGMDITDAEISMDKANAIIRMVLKTMKMPAGNKKYQKVMIMRGFTDTFDAGLISTSRFMERKDNKWRLKGKYAAFPVTRIL